MVLACPLFFASGSESVEEDHVTVPTTGGTSGEQIATGLVPRSQLTPRFVIAHIYNTW